MKIILLGFMGSGKSSIAKEFARDARVNRIELDDKIVRVSSHDSILEIFEKRGEAVFRELETKVLKEALAEESFVLSTGGGIVEAERNRELIASSDAIKIFLDTPFVELERRVGGEEGRPLFQSSEQARLRFDDRRPFYCQLADLVLQTMRHSPIELAEIIRSLISGEQGKWNIWSVIGDPVAHSLSPELYNTIFRASNEHRKFFTAYRVQDLERFIEDLKRNDSLRGLAVTIPHKERIVPLLDEVSEDARVLGAVNTVVKRKQKLWGFNTDWLGVRAPLCQRGDFAGRAVAIIGAGGTARAALYAVQSFQGKPTLINRSRERGARLASEFQVPFIELDSLPSLQAFDVVIHTTSYGMGDSSQSLFRSNAFRSDMVVMDAVYTPRITGILQEAQQAGAQIIPGEEMFLAQAQAQFALHHEREISKEQMGVIYGRE